jgi:hypothetical protein
MGQIWPWPELDAKQTGRQLECTVQVMNHVAFKKLIRLIEQPHKSEFVAMAIFCSKFSISNISHDGVLSIRNFIPMMAQPKNSTFDPSCSVHDRGHILAKIPNA